MAETGSVVTDGGSGSGGVSGGNQVADGVVGDESRTSRVVKKFDHRLPTTLTNRR